MGPRKTPRRKRKQNKPHILNQKKRATEKEEKAFMEKMAALEEKMKEPAVNSLCELLLNNWRTFFLLRTALMEQVGQDLDGEAMQHLMFILSQRAMIGFSAEKLTEVTEKYLLPYLKEDAERRPVILSDYAQAMMAEEQAAMEELGATQPMESEEKTNVIELP